MATDLQVAFHIVSANIEGRDERVELYRRMSDYSILRQLDPCDPPAEPVPIYVGDKEPVVMQAIAYGAHHLHESGDDGYLFPFRIVPVRTVGDTVFARSLKLDEPDDGRRVHVPPGGTLSFEEGSIVVELEAIEEFERQGRDGPLPLTPVIWTWMRIGSGSSQTEELYLLSAARRHDIALDLLAQVIDDLDELPEADGAPIHRQISFRLIARVESLCIALGRLVAMVEGAGQVLTTNPVANQTLPSSVTSRAAAVKAIRDSLEHIDERAQGLRARRKPDPDALSIFNHGQLLSSESITYGSHTISLGWDVPLLLSECRGFLKALAGR